MGGIDDRATESGRGVVKFGEIDLKVAIHERDPEPVVCTFVASVVAHALIRDSMIDMESSVTGSHITELE